MKTKILLTLSFLFFAGSVFAQTPDFYVSSNKVEQGDTLFVRVNIEPKKANLGFERVNFFKPEGANYWIAIVGIEAKEIPGTYTLKITAKEGSVLNKKITITKRKFPVTKLRITEELLNKGYTASAAIDNALNKENLDLNKVLKVFTPTAFFSKPFIYPLDKIENVGWYGNIRKSGNYSVQHLGVDLDAAENTPVYAVNNGMIAFTKDLSTYGKTLIINHGLGIYSLYLHLNEFKAKEGDRVKQGDIIGLSGNTGYSIAPHLHFSIKNDQLSVDPLKFIETLQKEMK